MPINTSSLILLIAMIASTAVYAQTPATEGGAEDQVTEATPDAGLRGEGGLGWIVNSGNTNNESFNGNITLKYGQATWRHTMSVSAKRVSEEQTTTAERYLFTAKTDYNFSESAYAFAAVRYDDDRFDGFEYQSSVSAGIGRHFIAADDHHLDVELGAGYRRNRVTATGEESQDSIARLAQHYDVMLSETTELFQDLLVESSSANTVSEFGAGVKVAVNSRLALQVSHTVKHNSNPPQSVDPADPTRKTDRTTRVTLVFGF